LKRKTLKDYKDTTKMNKEELRALMESDLKKDLHMHTCFSDGAMTPEELISMRVDEGYELLSITDHDGIGGSLIGMPFAQSARVTFIYGIEFDSEDEGCKDVHMLGYGFDPEDPMLREALEEILVERARRNDKFMAALNERGYNVTLDDIGSVNGGRYVGKPTFAVILKHKGIVESMQDAFNGLFREPDLRSIKKVTLSTKRVIDIIHNAGGLAVLAHPLEQRRREESYEEFRPRLYEILDRMVSYGIDGLECHHPSADPVQQEELVAYAKEHGLMITRGSDFHSHEHKRDFTRYHRP
jgi:hypothetical protein